MTTFLWTIALIVASFLSFIAGLIMSFSFRSTMADGIIRDTTDVIVKGALDKFNVYTESETIIETTRRVEDLDDPSEAWKKGYDEDDEYTEEDLDEEE